jgi:hypothetical protein
MPMREGRAKARASRGAAPSYSDDSNRFSIDRPASIPCRRGAARAAWTRARRPLDSMKVLHGGAGLHEEGERLMKLAEQGLGLSKIACVEAFGEPIVDGREKVTCHFPFALITQEPRQACGRA